MLNNWCPPETNILLYLSCISIIIFLKEKKFFCSVTCGLKLRTRSATIMGPEGGIALCVGQDGLGAVPTANVPFLYL